MKTTASIQPLIAHLWATNREQIIAQTRMHCHAKQLHSVMLLNSPRTIRLFVALPGHELWCNTVSQYKSGMSLGFHPHHCELTLLSVRGCFWNWTIEPGENFSLDKFFYSSVLRDGQGGFQRLGRERFQTRDFTPLLPGVSVYMPGSEMHTVYVGPNDTAAWLVFEGRESDDYDSHCFSTSNLERETVDGLYQAATEEDVISLLETAGLI